MFTLVILFYEIIGAKSSVYNISLYLFGFLIVRDKCERVWRLKLKRMNKWSSQVLREKLTHEIATCRARDWKVKSHANLEDFVSVSRERPTREILVKHSVW